jgi:hypothetical protein
MMIRTLDPYVQLTAAAENAASIAELSVVKRPGSVATKKRNTAKLTKVVKPPTRAEETDVAAAPAIQDTLKECLVLMEDILRKNQQQQGASTISSEPAQGTCYYCYVPDHYSSFCALKIKQNAERMASQKRQQKMAKENAK